MEKLKTADELMAEAVAKALRENTPAGEALRTCRAIFDGAIARAKSQRKEGAE